MKRARAALAAVLVGALAISACGGDSGSGALVWEKPPRLVNPPTLPRDHILAGRVLNDSLRTITLRTEDLRVLDADGNALKSSATTARSYVRGLYPPRRPPPGGLPESELIRLGRLLRLEPGKTGPLTVGWRVPSGGKAAAWIDYGGGRIAIPSAGQAAD